MKKKNIISLILSLLVMFNMAFCVSAIGLQHDDTDSVYGTSDLSSESVGSLSEDTDALNQVIDENPIDSVFTDGDAVGAGAATTDSMQAFLEEDLSKVTPDKVASSAKNVDLKKLLPVIFGVLAAVIIAAIVAIVFYRKRVNSKNNTQNNNNADINIEIFDCDTEGIRCEYEFTDSVSVKEKVPMNTPSANIPTVSDEAIACDITEEPITETDYTHNTIMSIYKGEASADSFSGEVISLTLANAYDLQIRQNISPRFAVSNNSTTTDYILVNGKYLYLNYRVFNKNEFVLYSDIAAVERCFYICNNLDAVVVPERQNILDFKPAVIEADGGDFAVVEKGKIVVE